MSRKEEKSKKRSIYLIFCVLAGMTALFPLSCGYIMSGGMVAEWVARVEELRAGLESGHIYLFPQMETLAETGILAGGMNSNLWFLLPGLLYLLSGSMVFAYRVFMLFLQVGTFLASMLFFGRVFPGEEGKVSAFYGMLLYMVCPYRIYVCYDLANLSQAVAWMLLPLYLWALFGVIKGEKRGRELLYAGVVLAGIGYADASFLVILLGLTVLAGIFVRRGGVFPALAVGCLFFAPGWYRLVQYLFLGAFREMEAVERSIMQYGYRLGHYFSTYAFRDGHPGMGLGMGVCLLAGIWLWFVENKRDRHRVDQVFIGLAVLLTCLSFYRFPWDLVQRLGGWALRLVSLIGTPAVFWGMAQFVFCVPGARSAGRIGRHEERWAAEVVPVLILLACVAVCVYQCNMLTYSRMPLEVL